jgi:hypothetical protein
VRHGNGHDHVVDQQEDESRAALSQGTGGDRGRMGVLHVLEVDTRHENHLANPSHDVSQVHRDVADPLLAVSSNPPSLLTACSCTLPLRRQRGR